MAEEALAEVCEQREKERKQEGISEGGNEQQLEAVVPAMEARGLKGKVRFGIAPGYLDLPAARIGPNEGKGAVNGVDRLVGKQVPGGMPFALAGDNEPEWGVGEVRMADLGVVDADFTFAVTAGIPEQAVSQSAFAATDCPSFARLSCAVNEIVVFLPAHDKAQAVAQQLLQPRTASKAAVKDV